MFAIKSLREQALKLLAADATTLAPAADANVIALVMNEISPGESLVFGDLVLATFDGSTPIAVGLGTQPTGENPFTAAEVISLKAPVGGFRWETTGVTNLPQTIFGFALLNDAMDAVLASELLETPVTLTAVDQLIDIGSPQLQLPANTIT